MGHAIRNPRLKWPTPRPAKGYRGIYINLDRVVGRREKIEGELRAHKLHDTYMRLAAIDGRAIAIDSKRRFSPFVEACFRSHAAAVDLARTASCPVHIVEDDTRFSARVDEFVLFAFTSGLLDRFDVIFLDMFVEPELKSLTRWSELYQHSSRKPQGDMASLTIADMGEFLCKAASSYVLGPRGAEKLHGHLQAEIDRGPGVPVDVYMGRLVRRGELSAAVVVPFLTTVDQNTGSISDIQFRMNAETIRGLLFLRSAFFVETDVTTDILPLLDAKIEMTHGQGLREIRDLFASRLINQTAAVKSEKPSRTTDTASSATVDDDLTQQWLREFHKRRTPEK